MKREILVPTPSLASCQIFKKYRSGLKETGRGSAADQRGCRNDAQCPHRVSNDLEERVQCLGSFCRSVS